ncbi:hypothetical protein [Paracraurococcus lichenis]|uniref:Uncharacterized protein n=1 Tax=Paracraurococcus lichenis TaxID=3064888 RepID=A0ABT9DU85_9PROT|nr:hypothetical protein [Paracraurococcus sp. LOR1-02]MDO9707461.1 hypothetical protein [Paracraurococcus sp. LOR1-02]
MASLLSWLAGRRTEEVRCTVDIEQTFDSLHAHAIPEGVTLRPGDRVVVHGVPAGIAYGEAMSLTCRATVYRAGWLARAWTEASAILELTELYHCGFEPKEAS